MHKLPEAAPRLTNCALNSSSLSGLQQGKQCFCGNSYGHHGSAFLNDTKDAINIGACHLRCNGQVDDVCNDLVAMGIFYSSAELAYNVGTCCSLRNAGSAALLAGVVWWILAVVLLLSERNLKEDGIYE